MFASSMPGRVQKSVRDKNLQFLRNRNIYSEQYFKFLYELVNVDPGTDMKKLKVLLEISLKFVLNTYLKTKETLRGDMRSWYNWFKGAFQCCPEFIEWFVDYVTEDPHLYIIPYLLSCGIKEIREFFGNLLKAAAESYVSYLKATDEAFKKLDILLETLMALLNREVVEYAKNAHEYFLFFYRYSRISDSTCKHLMKHDVISRFINFLTGKVPQDSSVENTPRRFTTTQTRELGPLHCTVAVLMLHLDLQPLSNVHRLDGDKMPSLRKIYPNPVLSISDDTDVTYILSESFTSFYIREALICLKENDAAAILVLVDALVYLSHMLSYFSDILIHQILQQFSCTPGNELRALAKLATQLCLLPDYAQENRLKSLISDHNDGILKIIRDSHLSDSQRSYQLIKLLTTATDQNDAVAHFLLSCAKNWQWCVDWLKKKMAEQNWLGNPATSNEESLTRNFQRTISAQATLEKATAMFTTSQGSSSDMDVDSIDGDDPQTVPSHDQPLDDDYT